MVDMVVLISIEKMRFANRGWLDLTVINKPISWSLMSDNKWFKQIFIRFQHLVIQIK